MWPEKVLSIGERNAHPQKYPGDNVFKMLLIHIKYLENNKSVFLWEDQWPVL
jgi:hypothetical protein